MEKFRKREKCAYLLFPVWCYPPLPRENSFLHSCTNNQPYLSLFSLFESQGELERELIIVHCNLELGNRAYSSYSLMHCCATGCAFIDNYFGLKDNLSITQLQNTWALEVIDKWPISSSHTPHLSTTILIINGHRETVQLIIIWLVHDPMVLVITWRKGLNITPWSLNNQDLFCSEFCKPNWIGKHKCYCQEGSRPQLSSKNNQVSTPPASSWLVPILQDYGKKMQYRICQLSQSNTPDSPKTKHLAI